MLLANHPVMVFPSTITNRHNHLILIRIAVARSHHSVGFNLKPNHVTTLPR
jgi:hypothetical protein